MQLLYYKLVYFLVFPRNYPQHNNAIATIADNFTAFFVIFIDFSDKITDFVCFIIFSMTINIIKTTF